MIANLFNTLVNAGILTALLTALIILIASLIVYIYIKVLYKPVAFGYTSTMKRVFAFLYDMILLNFGLITIAIIYSLATGTLLESVKEYSNYLNNSTQDTYYKGITIIKADFKTLQFYIVIVFSVYSFILEMLGKRTVGKKVMGIIVSTKKPLLLNSFLRNLVKIPVVAMWPMFLFISLIDKKRRWLHDFASRSVLKNENG
jgi:hypothetical protein